MKKNKPFLPFFILLFVFSVFGTAQASGDSSKLKVSEVPEVVLQAAQDALPDFSIKEAEHKTRNGATIYELEGYADNKKYELKIDATGKIIKMEQDD